MLLPLRSVAHELDARTDFQRRAQDEQMMYSGPLEREEERYILCRFLCFAVKGSSECPDALSSSILQQKAFEADGDGKRENSQCENSTQKQVFLDGCEESPVRDMLERQPQTGGPKSSSRRGFEGGSHCLSAVQLPLVLKLPASSGMDKELPPCACCEESDRGSTSVATPLALRRKSAEAFALLLRRRAEYNCFLPFLFQQQIHSNRPRKLYLLQQWEDEELQQGEQQQHVEALVGLRLLQTNSQPYTGNNVRTQRHLDKLREHLHKMNHQLLQLQEKRFLHRLLSKQELTLHPLLRPHRSMLLLDNVTECGKRRELLSQVAQIGLLVALMMGTGALLLNSVARGDH
ncbi:LOW QUALITY PROTEIN: hypothetical protein, conserved [Eimeria necatrix]|uniref:Transmembrane protein n=1 Tax=Eimeria necatrix TaxID=51315 RepID=U6MNG1_9EIME|nr:LOW QUALITY PROTEIN: hypothetical protein, conserved [Eimeria necatrix]CDJ64598.1 hypothetical protein, conserved [Eimeria necatrix]